MIQRIRRLHAQGQGVLLSRHPSAAEHHWAASAARRRTSAAARATASAGRRTTASWTAGATGTLRLRRPLLIHERPRSRDAQHESLIRRTAPVIPLDGRPRRWIQIETSIAGLVF